MIKAIETVYRGYRFRSRLEARWAVFFDKLSIAWEYEKEGYELKNRWYLPDFWLPEFRLFAEIKPFDRVTLQPDPEALALCTQFRDECIGAILLLREPGVYANLRCFDLTDSSGGSYDTDDVVWSWSIEQNRPTLFIYHDAREREFFADQMFREPLERVENEHSAGCDWWHDEIQAAFKAFRSSRFEHGENGYGA